MTVLLTAIAAANLTVAVAARLAPTVPAAVELGELVLHLAVIPVFLVWFYRARKNADGRGQRQRWGPGWTIGAWFVPIADLWFPYQIMADIWRANLPAERRTERAWLPGFWWGCLIAGYILGETAFFERVVTASDRSTSGQLPVAVIPYCLSLAAAAILLIVIVRMITRGPVGRVPAAAQQGAGPQDGVAGPGPVYPQIPMRSENGRLAAGAGYALSGLVVVIAAALAAAAIAGQSISTTPVAAHTPTPAARTPTPGGQQLTGEQLRAGDCIQRPRDVNTGRTWPDLVTAVPCTERHIAEIIYSGNYWPATMAFPGNATIYRQGGKECVKAFHAYDGISYADSEYTGYDITPQGRSDWAQGDRQLTCVVYLRTPRWRRGEALYASIKDSHE